MTEKQPIITLKSTITQIQQLNLTDITTLREKNSDLFDALWIALFDFGTLALRAKHHTNSNGKCQRGNASILASIHKTPDDVSAQLLTHLFSKLDKIIVLPADEAIRYANTIVYHFCNDLARHYRPAPASLDQPIGDGSVTLGEMLTDEDSDFVDRMVKEDQLQEEQDAAREVVMRLMVLKDTKPGVAAALLSKLVGVAPRVMVTSMRKHGVIPTVEKYASAVCKTVSIPVPAASDRICPMKDLEYQLLVMMKTKVNYGILVLSKLTGIRQQAIAASICKSGVEATVRECGNMIRSKLATGSAEEQADLRTKIRWAMTNLSLHTYDTDKRCASVISKLASRHAAHLIPQMPA